MWLGQTQALIEFGPNGQGKPSEAAAGPRPVQWLTLLPSVPAFQELLAPVELETALIEPVSEEPRPDEPKGDVQPGVTVPAAPSLLILSAPVEPESAANSSVPVPCAKIEIQRRADPVAQQQTPQPDKGELIWATEFVVAENTPEPQTPPAVEAIPVERKERGPANETSMRQGGSETDSSQQQTEERTPDRRPGQKQTSRPAPDAPVERSAPAKPVEPATREASPALASRFDFRVPEAVPQGNPPVEFKSTAAAAPEKSGELAVRSVALESPRPLRPAQIATLYVDVPAPDGAANAGPMRLAVSQRGDQVSVRLRSWDIGAAPLENERMRPLLQSLADQGYAASKKSLGRIDENAPVIIEHLKDKPLATAETAGGDNDRQSFQNADDRQRKNQERQQQAFFLRRQMQNARGGQFELQSHSEDFSSSQQQGVVR